MRPSSPPGIRRVRAFWSLLHPLPSLLTVLAAGAFVLLAARGLPPPGRLLYVLVIEAAMQFSISAFNDYFDRRVDAGRADKPVASGEVSTRAALLLGLALALLALSLAVPLGPWVWALTAVGLGGGLLYDAGLKYTAFSWLPFAISFPTLPLWAWAVASPDGHFPLRLLWIVPVAVLLVLGIHLADTLPDLAADAEAGVRGLGHQLGLGNALLVCWAAFGGTALLTLLLTAILPYRLEWYVPGLIVGVLLMAAGVSLYLLDRSRLKTMSLMLELGAIALAIGWFGGITL